MLWCRLSEFSAFTLEPRISIRKDDACRREARTSYAAVYSRSKREILPRGPPALDGGEASGPSAPRTAGGEARVCRPFRAAPLIGGKGTRFSRASLASRRRVRSPIRRPSDWLEKRPLSKHLLWPTTGAVAAWAVRASASKRIRAWPTPAGRASAFSQLYAGGGSLIHVRRFDGRRFVWRMMILSQRPGSVIKLFVTPKTEKELR